MIVKEVQDFYEFEVEGLNKDTHVIYEKISQVEPMFNDSYQYVGTHECEGYEEISVYVGSESLIKKAAFIIGKDVNNISEALSMISHLYAHKLSA